MLRKLLLPVLATAALAGCVTDYGYRNGNGDYYYGQPRVEYRELGPGGYYGGVGVQYGYGGYGYGGYGGYGSGPIYFHDRYGRLVYGYPGGYYGSPYYGGNGWYSPRPDRDHDGNHGGNTNNDNRSDRPPPWRDLRGMQKRIEDLNGYPDGEERPRPFRRPQVESNGPSQTQMIRPQAPAQSSPVMRERREPTSRSGAFMGEVRRAQSKAAPTLEE